MAILQEKCSVCFSHGPKLLNTVETDATEIRWSTKLSLCVPEVEWGDDCYICQNCMGQLEVAYTFRHLCLQSYKLRKQHQLLAVKKESAIVADLTQNAVECKRRIVKCPLYKKAVTSVTDISMHVDECVQKPADTERASLLCSPNVTSKLIKECDQVGRNEPKFTDFKKEVAVAQSSMLKTKKNRKYPMKCEYCLKDFNRRQHLVAHIRRIHTLEKPYACNECEERFPTSHNLLVHRNKHTNSRQFVCSHCGKTFRTSSDLYHHMKIHLNKREYKCEICEKTFNTTSILRAHKICVHVDPTLWKYPCTFCDRRFPMKSGLTAHVRRHTGEKNFVCHICGKRFSDKDMVLKHFRSHTNERLYKCHVCAKEYKASGGLNVHLKKAHNLGTASLPKPAPKKYICHMCSKGFVTGNKLEKHIRSHTGERPFSCSVCTKKFTDGWYLKVHLRTKHAEHASSDNDLDI